MTCLYDTSCSLVRLHSSVTIIKSVSLLLISTYETQTLSRPASSAVHINIIPVIPGAVLRVFHTLSVPAEAAHFPSSSAAARWNCGEDWNASKNMG